MSIEIHYDGATYTEVNHDLDDTISRIASVLNSENGAGLVRVTTKKGTVDLFVSRYVPVAVECKETRSGYEGREATIL